MKVKFKVDVDIKGMYEIDKGEEFEAFEYEESNGEKYIMIKMRDGSTIKAPESETDEILDIIKKRLKQSKTIFGE